MPIQKSSDATDYVSRPLLQLQSGNAPQELIRDILQISVEESLHLPAMFTLVVHNTYETASREEKLWSDEKYFKIGDRLKIGFVASTTEAVEFRKKEQGYLIDGEITAIEVNFTETSEAHIVVRGYDLSHRLHRGRYNRSFLNQTDSDIVRRVSREMGIRAGQIDPSGEKHDYVFQENQTNMEFLRERAARIGFELFIQDNMLNFRKPESKTSLNLEWQREIKSFSTRVTSAEQVSAVEVRSWDYTQKKVITSTKQSEQLITKTGNRKGSTTASAFNIGKPKMIVVDQPVSKPKEADRMAQALCDELGGEFVFADGKATGNPEIRTGRVIQLQGMGDRYSGKYYVTETRHFYAQRIYSTEFSVRGLRGGSLLTTIDPPVRLQPGQTLLVGIVTENKDPEGWGRVKVKLPTLTEEHTSNWARVVGLGAAGVRGFYCLPEVGDEVLVGFEHGDIHRPYIIGGVWNGKDATPRTIDDTITGKAGNSKVRVRTIKTRTGHTIEFVEEDRTTGSQDTKCDGIYVHTAGGHHIRMNDKDTDPTEFVEIETSGGHKIRMDDSPTSKEVNVTTSRGHTINLSDTNRLIQIRTPTGQSLSLNDITRTTTLQTTGAVNIQAGNTISLTAPIVSVTAAANINLKAPTVTIATTTLTTTGVLTNNGMPVMVIPP